MRYAHGHTLHSCIFSARCGISSYAAFNPVIKVAGFSDSEAILSYLDDITILSNGAYQHHIGLIFKFLDKIIHHGFTLNLEKCEILRTSVKLLGHIVGRMGVSPTPDYVLKVADFRNFRV